MAIPSNIIALANMTDPTPFLESHGYMVVWEGGRHGYVTYDGKKVYRITRKDDGRYVSCLNQGSEKIGDNIALARSVDNSLSFSKAVNVLTYCSSAQGKPKSGNPEVKGPGEPLILPPEADQESGRRYLIHSRCILEEEVKEAENQGAIRYFSGRVGFCGYDVEGNLRNVAFRSYLTNVSLKKWNQTGSTLRYSTIFKGAQETVWIVEGGVDGLAVRCLYRKEGWEPPTAIVTGGASVLVFLENPAVKEILLRAKKVWLAREWEKDEATQQRVDLNHVKQKAKVEVIVAGGLGQVKVWVPPKDVKDIADFYARRVGQLKVK
jgi:hypothetical protein